MDNSAFRTSFAVLLLTSLAASQKNAPSWTQWRGSARTNISAETGWRTDGDTEKLWTADVGMGYSTVSVADGRLYTQGHDKEVEKDTIYCLDALTGKEIWSHTFKAKTLRKAHHGGSLATPSIDGKVVWASNREGNLFRFDKKGKITWQTNLIKKHGASMPTWGLAASPMVLEEMIVMNVGPVIALTRQGKVKWKTEDFGHAYATPADFTYKGTQYLAVFSGSGLHVIRRKNGKTAASAPWKTRYDVNAATPVVAGNKIFVSSGYNRGCALMEFDGKSLKTLWENKSMRNHMSGCVLFGDHLYGFDEGTVKCLDLEGETKWSKRGLGKGALTLAAGKLILIGARGDLVFANATPKEFDEIARAKVLEPSGRKWTTPVLCGGLLYVRGSLGELVCVDRRAQKKAKAKKR